MKTIGVYGMPLTDLNSKRDDLYMAIEEYRLAPNTQNLDAIRTAGHAYMRAMGLVVSQDPAVNVDTLFTAGINPAVRDIVKQAMGLIEASLETLLLSVNITLGNYLSSGGFWGAGPGGSWLGSQDGPITFTHNDVNYSLFQLQFRTDALKLLFGIHSTNISNTSSMLTKLRVVINDGLITLITNDHINTITTSYNNSRYVTTGNNHPQIDVINSMLGVNQTLNVKLYLMD